MGLDIYVGTLTRYYKHNWKTVVQQMAEQLGIECKIIRACEEIEVSIERVLSDTKEWEAMLFKSIFTQGEPFPPWTEDYDTTPYYTNKPDWDAIGALIMYIAYHIYQQPLPKMVSKNHDFFNDEYVKRAIKDEEKMYSLVQGDGWWAPFDDAFMFRFPLMNGTEIWFGTSGLLKKELKAINDMEWKASEEEIIQWEKTEGYPIDMTIQSNKITQHNDDDEKTTDKTNQNPDENKNKNDEKTTDKTNQNPDENKNKNDEKTTDKTNQNPDENNNKNDEKTTDKTNQNPDESRNENDENKNRKINSNWNIVKKNVHKEYDTISLAKFAFSIMWQAAHFSLKYRVPIIYDS